MPHAAMLSSWETVASESPVAFADEFARYRDVTLSYGFLALLDSGLTLAVEQDRQRRGEQNQHRQCRYHGPDNTTSPPLLPDILAFDFLFGDLADGRCQRGDLVPESGVAQGKTRDLPRPGPSHIEILGLGGESTAECGITRGRGGAEITAVVVPDPGPVSKHDQQMIRALAGNPVSDLFAQSVRPGRLR